MISNPNLPENLLNPNSPSGLSFFGQEVEHLTNAAILLIHQLILLFQINYIQILETYKMKVELNSHNFNSILINENEILYLPYKIEAFLVFDKTIVLLFQIEKNESDFSQNIIAYNKLGKEVWKIKADSSNNRYVGINREKKLLTAVNFSTNTLIINPETGEVLKEEWRK